MKHGRLFYVGDTPQLAPTFKPLRRHLCFHLWSRQPGLSHGKTVLLSLFTAVFMHTAGQYSVTGAGGHLRVAIRRRSYG